MLFCFLATLVPTNSFHHHEASSHCNETDANLEKNPCHVSVYHAVSNKPLCEHDTHLSNILDTCEFCKIVTPRRYYYDVVTTYQCDMIPVLNHPDFLIGYESLKIYNLSNSILGRAPPVC